MRMKANLPSLKKNNKKRGLAKVLFFHYKQKKQEISCFCVITSLSILIFLPFCVKGLIIP